MDEVFHQKLQDAPWNVAQFRRLPGTRALDADGWLMVDEVYAAQMALRDRLLAEKREVVLRLMESARQAAEELYAEALRLAPALGFGLSGDAARRPDGVEVSLDPGDPLGTLGRLFQEDLCILEKHGDEHVLTGAVLCFPFGWSLAEKLGMPMGRIHQPVAHYDDGVARRVQRMLDGLKPGQPIWRANLGYPGHGRLHFPLTEAERRPGVVRDGPFMRSERQCLLRLPRTDAIVFTIHTFLVRTTEAERQRVAAPA